MNEENKENEIYDIFSAAAEGNIDYIIDHRMELSSSKVTLHVLRIASDFGQVNVIRYLIDNHHVTPYYAIRYIATYSDNRSAITHIIKTYYPSDIFSMHNIDSLVRIYMFDKDPTIVEAIVYGLIPLYAESFNLELWLHEAKQNGAKLRVQNLFRSLLWNL